MKSPLEQPEVGRPQPAKLRATKHLGSETFLVTREAAWRLDLLVLARVLKLDTCTWPDQSEQDTPVENSRRLGEAAAPPNNPITWSRC